MEYEKIEDRSAWPSDSNLGNLIAEQLQANEQLEAVGAPPAGSVEIQKVRKFRLYNADGSFKPTLLDSGRDQELQTSTGPLPVRVFEIDDARGIYLHFHGGGWVMGSIYEQDHLLWTLAQETRLTVVSVDYPLAPETGLESIIQTVVASAEAAMDFYAEQPLYIGGESAGSHLALCATLGLASDSDRLARVKALNLSYGIYDLSMTPSQRLWGDRMMGLSTSYLEWFYEIALPGWSAEDRMNSSVSPLYRSNLRGLPPALFTIGEYDPLLDDSLFMAARWKQAGNHSHLAVYPCAPHGFNGLPTRMSHAANTRIAQFLNNAGEYAESSLSNG